MTDEIEQALDNLQKIKEGESESVQAQATPEPTDEPAETDALSLAESETDRLFEEHDEVRQNVDRENVHVFVARWNGRNGVCKYGRRLRNKRHFGKKMPTLPRNHEHHVIGANEKILEQGNREEFLDVVRHELAHVVVYEIHGTSQKHNHHWKAMASKLGADPKANHDKRDREDEYQYYAYCPECGHEYGKTKRSKTIKLPFRYGCGKCGTSGLSSYEKGQAPPDEHGVVKVESIPWEDQSTWWEQGAPRSLS